MARIYCNHSTREAFQFIFEGFFTSVEKATGHKLKFKVFDPSGNIMSIHFDMEAAQVQGFATTLQQMNDSAVSGIEERNLDVLVQYVLKLCFVHFERQVFSICPHTAAVLAQPSFRRTDSLVPIIGSDAVKYLNRFRALESPEDIATWHAFCSNHPSVDLKSM